jgi:hypothetical protein
LRGDREQFTTLVKAHIAAVVRGVSVSVHGLMSQLEREPGEFIVSRWVRDRSRRLPSSADAWWPPRKCCGMPKTRIPARTTATPERSVG